MGQFFLELRSPIAHPSCQSHISCIAWPMIWIFDKKCYIVSKFPVCSVINSFSKIWPLSSSCFPNKDLSFSHTYFGVLNLSWLKINSLEMWMHMKPNYSSSLFKCIEFSRECWGLSLLPMMTLYIPFLHNKVCISSLQ